MLINTIQSYGSLILRCGAWFAGKELGGTILTAWGTGSLYNGSLQNKS